MAGGRRYLVEIAGVAYEVAVEERDGRLVARLAGEEEGVTLVAAPAPHQLLLAEGGRCWEAWTAIEGDEATVLLGSQQVEARVRDARAARLAAAGGHSARHRTGRLEVRAPMPGLVVRLEVGVGDAVEHGQNLLALEAMKMENEIVAPRQGTVREILVRPGQTVDGRQLLVVIE